MPRGSVNRVRNTRIGLKLDTKAIGWALLRLTRPEPAGAVEHGDPLDLAREALRQNRDAPLIVYMNDEAYRGSHGEAAGLAREEHLVRTSRVAQQLADEGFHVTIWEVI